jgi:hypothetical protein
VPDGRITRWTACVRVRIASAPWRRMVVMSPPEQKVPPAPVSTMTRTASSAIADLTAVGGQHAPVGFHPCLLFLPCPRARRRPVRTIIALVTSRFLT